MIQSKINHLRATLGGVAVVSMNSHIRHIVGNLECEENLADQRSCDFSMLVFERTEKIDIGMRTGRTRSSVTVLGFEVVETAAVTGVQVYLNCPERSRYRKRSVTTCMSGLSSCGMGLVFCIVSYLGLY